MTGEPPIIGACECAEDGHCPRYGRHMGGRFRELCRGVDVDAGTAAAFREQWAREAPPKPDARNPSGPIPLLLQTDQMPGDTVAMTAAVYSLHRAHPGRYATAVESPHPAVFAYNPDVVPAAPGAAPVRMHYPAIHRCNERAIHFMQGWCEHLGAALGVPVPLFTDRPRLYFPNPDPPVGDYWVVCGGGKRDFTCKLWGSDRYQRVVDLLRGAVKFVQVGGADDDHPRLVGAEYAVGKTTLRGLFGLIRRSRGVLCGVSLPMHVAAALDRPAVVVAGGREPVPWNAYPRQQYVHTVGALPCRSAQGHAGRACWRSRVAAVGDGAWHDRDLCQLPVLAGGGEPSPACMAMISPAEVATLVLRYDVQYGGNHATQEKTAAQATVGGGGGEATEGGAARVPLRIVW